MEQDWVRPAVAEFIGTFTLVFIGVGAIWAAGQAGEGLLLVALAHGLAIAVMVSAVGHISGGHFNPAVTVGALAGGRITPQKAALYIGAQLLGGVVAAYLLLKGVGFTVGTMRMGTPQLGAGISVGQAILIEAVLTFFLVFVVFGTGIDRRGPKIGGLAIGLTIAMGTMMGGPLTGAAMNPARAFGPALAGSWWQDQLVYWVGPLIGAILAGIVYGYVLAPRDEDWSGQVESERPSA